MEFPFYPANCLPCDDQGFAMLDGSFPQRYRRSGNGRNAHQSSIFGQGVTSTSPPEQQLDAIIDQMGEASA